MTIKALSSPQLGGGLPRAIYWGPALSGDDSEEMMLAADRLDYTGGMMDGIPDLSICPEARRSFPGQPGMVLRAGDGTPLAPRLVHVSDARDGDVIRLTYGDADLGLTYVATFRLHATSGVIEASASLHSEVPIRVEWLAAPVLPAPQLSDEMIDFSGRWIGEFQPCHSTWGRGHPHARVPHRSQWT